MLTGVVVVVLAGVLLLTRIVQKRQAQEESRGDAMKQPEETETSEKPKAQEETENAMEQNILENTEGSEVSNPVQGTSVMQPEAGSIVETSAMTEAESARYFFSQEIADSLFNRISGVSYKENDNISREDLCYLRVLHMDLEGKTHVGELIVNKRIAGDILAIMKELYANAYPIEKMILIDAYGADDNESMADNNSSAFNYRVIAGTDQLSKHSLGMAIDINPKYNPYVRTGQDGGTIIEPEGSEAYTDREAEFSYKIEEGDLCCRLFQEHGFTWGGDWQNTKDYQHFEKN